MASKHSALESNDLAPHRIRRIRVEKLFGLYDHDIPLSLEDRVTILHGPNGVGKTVILKMVHDFFRERWDLFFRIPFKSLSIELSNGSELSVQLKNQLLEIKENDSIRYVRRAAFEQLAMRIRSRLPWLDPLGQDHWVDEQIGDVIDSFQVIERYGEILPKGLRGGRDSSRKLHAKIQTHLIETQRILRRTQDSSKPQGSDRFSLIPAVLEIAKELAKEIDHTMSRYGRDAQALDQSFPQRLLSTQSQADRGKLQIRLTQLDERREELDSLGILEDKPEHPFGADQLGQLDDTKTGVMALYIDDTERKLGVFDDLVRKMKLFRDNINRKLRNKQIRFDRERGLVIERNDGTEIALDALSSGEQHELVLHYDLLFKTPKNTLVLIDEPELSLHVTWQKRFLADLLEIVKATEIDVLVATHSPFIAGARIDLMVDLKDNIS